MRILALIKPSLRLCNNTAADLGQLHGVWQVGQISWGSLLMCGQGASQLDLMKTGLGARSLGWKGAFGMRDRQVGLKNLSCTHMRTQTHTHTESSSASPLSAPRRPLCAPAPPSSLPASCLLVCSPSSLLHAEGPHWMPSPRIHRTAWFLYLPSLTVFFHAD